MIVELLHVLTLKSSVLHIKIVPMIVVDKEHAKLTCVDVGMVMEEEIVLLKCEEYIHKYGEQNLLFINHISG